MKITTNSSHPFAYLLLVFAIAYLSVTPESVHAVSKNGFDLKNSEFPASEIKRGGPPRDGIPAINNPQFVSVTQAADFMQAQDRVVGLVIRGEARAYPIKIMNYHEIVNDNISGFGVLISYCPLCGTAMAFDSYVDGRELSFGVSGLLHNNDVLMYDHQTDSLWSQILGRAISGSARGAKLLSIPLILTHWEAWSQSYPLSSVLSIDTGYTRDYNRDPYQGYEDSSRLYFPVSNKDRRYSNKEWVIALQTGGITRAWPFSELEKSWKQDPQKQFLEDSINGFPVRVYYQPDSRIANITDDEGQLVVSVSAYWFAWIAFHPDTEVYTNKK